MAIGVFCIIFIGTGALLTSVYGQNTTSLPQQPEGAGIILNGTITTIFPAPKHDPTGSIGQAYAEVIRVTQQAANYTEGSSISWYVADIKNQICDTLNPNSTAVEECYAI